MSSLPTQHGRTATHTTAARHWFFMSGGALLVGAAVFAWLGQAGGQDAAAQSACVGEALTSMSAVAACSDTSEWIGRNARCTSGLCHAHLHVWLDFAYIFVIALFLDASGRWTRHLARHVTPAAPKVACLLALLRWPLSVFIALGVLVDASENVYLVLILEQWLMHSDLAPELSILTAHKFRVYGIAFGLVLLSFCAVAPAYVPRWFRPKKP